MRKTAPILLIALALAGRAEIVDRIAVAVGNRVITTSDIERQIRVAAFLSGARPDISAAARRKTAEAMVDQKLIQRELETSRYAEPVPADLDTAYAGFRQKFYPTDEVYRKALAEAGVAEADVKQQLQWQRVWLGFVGARFRSAAQVGEEEIREYFEKTVAPAARAANPGAEVALEDYRERIVTKLMGDREDRQIEQWLSDARHQTEIVFHEEAFQ